MTRATKSRSGTSPAPTIPAIPPADVLGRLAALKTAATPDLKQQWRELFAAEPPPYNRRFLEDYVGALVSSSQRRKASFSALMLDLDFFKQVNDTHGHEAGDKVIKTLADLLARSVRGSDFAVRYGGEEFLVVLVDTGIEPALKVAEKIRAEVEATKIPLPTGILQKTISIGVAEFPTDADTFWQVVKFADVALYKAKAGGRNRVVRFLPEMWDENGSY